MNVIRKDATIENTGSDDAFPGSFEVILSTPSQDRDGDELKSEDWEQPLPAHITFDQDHGMNVASTVGSGTPSINDDGQLVVSGTYSSLDRAQEVRTLVREGHIRTTSVAFMTKTVTKGGKQTSVRELLNGAFVAIPSNREAMVLASKSAKDAAETAAREAFDVKGFAETLAKAVRDDLNTSTTHVAVKTVADSYEQRQQAISDALDAKYQSGTGGNYCYAWPLATFEDSVVYRVGSSDSAMRGQWQADYELGDDGTVTLGEPKRVNLVEVVQPVADATPKGFRLAIAPKNFDPADADVDAAPTTDSKAVTDSAAAAKAAAAETVTEQDLQAQLQELKALATPVASATAD